MIDIFLYQHVVLFSPDHPDLNPWSKRAVGRVVILLIDALRADFVLNNQELREIGIHYHQGSSSLSKDDDTYPERPKIQFLRKMIDRGKSVCLVAEATPPTVTLPRLKVKKC